MLPSKRRSVVKCREVWGDVVSFPRNHSSIKIKTTVSPEVDPQVFFWVGLLLLGRMPEAFLVVLFGLLYSFFQ